MQEKPLWISHRGFKATAAENTFEAFRDACARGFAALETDLRCTQDGEIVLCHDADLRRLAGRRERVAELSRSALEQVVLPGDARLMFFDAFIQAFPGCAWTFDIKPETAVETLRALHAWTTKQNAREWLTVNARFLFWDAHHERFARELFPQLRCYAREPECWRAGLGMLLGMPGWSGVRPQRTYALTARLAGRPLLSKEIVHSYHARGARVVAYLPETEAEARSAVLAGVDEILTNGPIVAAP